MTQTAPSPPFWARPLPVALIVLAYCLLHGLLRWFASDTIGIDEANETVLVQSLEWGYVVRQPPLYDWLLWIIHRWTGPGIGSTLLLKYAALCGTCLFLHRIALRLTPDLRIAALAAFSPVALYQIGWNYHEGVTHTALLSAAVAGSILALMRFAEAPGAGRAAALGAAIGLGLLSKHAYYATLAQMAVATLAVAPVRRRLASPWLLLSAALAALIYAPYAQWLATVPGDLASVTDDTLRSAEARNLLLAALDACAKPLLFLSPLALILAAFGPRWRAPAAAPADWLRVFRAAALAAVAGLVIAVLVFGVTMVKERHLHALLIALPAWMWAELARHGPSTRGLNRSLSAFAALAVLVLALRALAFAAPDETFCGSRCRQAKPYDVLAPALTDLGAARATLVAGDRFTAGNLRALLPEARIAGDFDTYTPPADAQARAACWLVRDLDVPPDAPEPGETVVDQSWPHLWKDKGWKYSRFALSPLSLDDPRCKL